jgi:hypothetical protein
MRGRSEAPGHEGDHGPQDHGAAGHRVDGRVRARAAALIGDSGFLDRVRELLRAAPAVHADETPARAAVGNVSCSAATSCFAIAQSSHGLVFLSYGS